MDKKKDNKLLVVRFLQERSNLIHENLRLKLRIESLKKKLTLTDVMQWVAVKDRLPIELEEEPHLKKLWVQTEEFGCTVAFFKDGEFMKDYSAKLLNVIRWMELPEPPCA